MSKKDAAADIRPSVGMEEILREARMQPLVTFDLYPVVEVRDQCIRTLEVEGNWNSGYYLPADTESASGWAERRIYVLRGLGDPLWKKLLEWYVYHAGTYGRGRFDFDEETVVLAIEFAIALAQRERLGQAEAVHAVSSRLRRDSRLYWHAPSMRSFLEWLLSTDETGKNSATEWCAGWALAETAIRRIVEAEDITFLPRLESLAGVENWEVVRGSDPFGLAHQSAIISRAVTMLREARERQMPDLSSTVGARLRREAGFWSRVVVGVDWPRRVKQGEEVQVRIWFSNPEEITRLARVTPRISVFCEVEGFNPPEPKTMIFRHASVFEQVTLKPTRGNKRFWLTFCLAKKENCCKGGHVTTEIEELAKMAGYIFVEE